MSIQTAGEQKYYEFIQERAKNIRMGMIVWVSLLAVAVISFSGDKRIAVILAVAGLLLAAVNIKSQTVLKKKLDVVADRASFYNQLIANDAVELPGLHLMVTNEYVLSGSSDISIYRLADMKKVEVGIQDGGYKPHKSLFLTDHSGERHEVASCPKDSGLEEDFNQAYEVLCGRIC